MSDQEIKDKEAAYWAGVDEKVANLSSNFKKAVFSINIAKTEPGEFVTGYAFEPDLITQLRLMDKSGDSSFSMEACSAALDSLIIPAETDPLILDKTGKAVYWKAACMSLSQFLVMAVPTLKKK